jgi:hypothetical protein
MLHPSLREQDRIKRFMIAATAVGLALTACATRAGTSVAPSATSSTPQAIRSTAPAKPAAKNVSRKHVQSQPRSCEPVRGGTKGKVAQLVDVWVGTHEGYDRVTLEFGSPADGKYFGLPPYEVASASPPITEDGSGELVDIDGSHLARAIFHGASGVDGTADEFTITYSGPRDFRPGFQALAEARETGDFEAVLSWAFGTNSASCWDVQVLQDPLRVVIDFPHD